MIVSNRSAKRARKLPMVTGTLYLVFVTQPLLGLVVAGFLIYSVVSGLTLEAFLNARMWIAGEDDFRRWMAGSNIVILALAGYYFVNVMVVGVRFALYKGAQPKDEFDEYVLRRHPSLQDARANCRQWKEFGIILLLLSIAIFALTV